ncbi:MAG: hypothetical protein AMXMBFR64_45470 [Myxococcales bacterium]
MRASGEPEGARVLACNVEDLAPHPKHDVAGRAEFHPALLLVQVLHAAPPCVAILARYAW